MRIVVFGPARRVGAWVDDQILDLNQVNPALPSRLQDFIEAGGAALDAAQRAVDTLGSAPDGAVLPLASTRLHPPWSRGNRIACAGANYVMHVVGIRTADGRTIAPEEQHRQSREAGPWGFWKVPDEVKGPEDEVVYPARATRFDYEGEAVVVIGKHARDVPVGEANACFWGYSVLNDWSIRNDMGQPRVMAFNLPKNFDGSTSLGPSIVVGDFDPQTIPIQTRVNGQLRQDYGTRDMTFSFAEFLQYLSRDFTFHPGDLIAGGTGAGTAMDASRAGGGTDLYLNVGDVVEVSSPEVGTLRNRVIAKPRAK
jgi:2-keto-4-pentenoate hydratase/2-oxohepta-3-ene-1,7-dioic acid hydratase in catechol pathway